MSIMRNGAEKDAVRWCHLIILIILGIYYMLFLPKVQGAHSLLQAYKKLQIHCCKTLLQLQNIDKTLQKHPLTEERNKKSRVFMLSPSKVRKK